MIHHYIKVHPGGMTSSIQKSGYRLICYVIVWPVMPEGSLVRAGRIKESVPKSATSLAAKFVADTIFVSYNATR